MLIGEAAIGEAADVLSNGDTKNKKSIRMEQHWNRTNMKHHIIPTRKEKQFTYISLQTLDFFQ